MSAPSAIAERLGLAARGVPVVLQSEVSECGLACLAMVAHHHGHRIELATLRRRHPPSVRGARLDHLSEVAAQLHFSSRALRLEVPQLSQLRTPCVLHWDLSHFVVLVRARGSRIVIHDPARGLCRLSLAQASRHFTGIALELEPTPAFREEREERRLRVRELWTRIRGAAESLGVIFALSLMLQIMLLAAPFYIQIVVDDVLTKGDASLLRTLALGFGLLLLLRVCASAVREQAILQVSSLLSFQMASNLMAHLIRVPLSYFEKRHVGDVLSRFGSLAPIEDLLSKGFVAAVLDGVMSGLTLALMFFYSPALTGITLLSALAYGVLRTLLYEPLRRLSEEEIIARSREETALIEIARGMQPIKILGAEARREGLWQNRRADVLNARVRSGRWEIGFGTARTLLMGIENLVIVYVGAGLVLESSFSVGMLFAYLSYKEQFTSRIASLVDAGIRYRMLDVHLSRLSDLVYTPEEAGLRGGACGDRSTKGAIELRGVGFRYSESDPYVLRDVSVRVEAGSWVTLVGRSGSGKTTLLKILMGLLEPTEGEVLVDGVPLREFGISAYRRQLGAVMQDDQLFDGTISENISGFDRDGDAVRVQRAARAARVHEEIASMAMGYGALVSNMGSSLSGGQRQRLLLARAFYREPRVLLLDEGTANLDPRTLEQVRVVLAAARCTRILVTHQPEVVHGSDAVLEVGESGLRGISADEWLGGAAAAQR